MKLLVRYLYALLLFLRGPAFHPSSSPSRIRLICISDTHSKKPCLIPLGDVLIHAGDLTNLGSTSEIQAHVDWLSSLPHPNKIVIAGNHDSYFDSASRSTADADKSIRWGDIHYLQHSTTILVFPRHGNRKLTFYGAPQIPQCGGTEFAFQYQRSSDAWSETVPRAIDVLITHTPPKYHLDLSSGLGCEFLLEEVWKARPKVHVFGHVHAGYGREHIFWDEGQQAYERICARGDNGVLIDVLAVRGWLVVIKMIWYSVLGILWSRMWGGDSKGGIMINASLTYGTTSKLENPPQVVDI